MIPFALDDILKRLNAGEQPSTSVRSLLSWFGAKRRGYWVVQTIRDALNELGIHTNPDFESAWIDATIEFVRRPVMSIEDAAEVLGFNQISDVTPENEELATAIKIATGAIKDPAFRIGQLAAADKRPISVKPDATITQATTLMMMHDFSQLPVMQSEREVKGVVSWKTIGTRAALGLSCVTVRDCMDEHPPEVPARLPLLAAIQLIAEHGYALVRQPDRRVTGLVTTTDLSLEFRQLAEPFLLVGEIENSIRGLIGDRIHPEELLSIRDPADPREKTRVDELTFGEYILLMEKPSHWDKLELSIDRVEFIKRLDAVRELRNEIMHFSPDPLELEDLETLRSFAAFIRGIVEARRQ